MNKTESINPPEDRVTFHFVQMMEAKRRDCCRRSTCVGLIHVSFYHSTLFEERKKIERKDWNVLFLSGGCGGFYLFDETYSMWNNVISQRSYHCSLARLVSVTAPRWGKIIYWLCMELPLPYQIYTPSFHLWNWMGKFNCYLASCVAGWKSLSY